MGYTGWFPCFSPNGEHVLTGSGDLYIDKTQHVGYGYQARWGGNSTWVSNTRLLYQSTPTPAVDGNWGLWAVAVGGSPQDLHLLMPVNEFAAANGGRWAAWGSSGFKTSWGSTVAGARGPAVNSTQLAYLLDWNTAVNQRLMLDGVLIDTAPIVNVMMTEQGICWSRFSGDLGRDVWGMRLDVADTAASVAASTVVEFAAIPIDTPSGPWILSYENSRLILRPWGETDGYVVSTGETMYPAGVYRTSTSTFRIAWSSSSGVYAEVEIDPTDDRVALGGTSGSGGGSTTPGGSGTTPGSETPAAPSTPVTPAWMGLTNHPPLRHRLSDDDGVMTHPWQRWVEAVAEALKDLQEGD